MPRTLLSSPQFFEIWSLVRPRRVGRPTRQSARELHNCRGTSFKVLGRKLVVRVIGAVSGATRILLGPRLLSPVARAKFFKGRMQMSNEVSEEQYYPTIGQAPAELAAQAVVRALQSHGIKIEQEMITRFILRNGVLDSGHVVLRPL
jgi:hypothetical protein